MSIPAPVLLARLESQLESVRLALVGDQSTVELLRLLDTAMRLAREARAAL